MLLSYIYIIYMSYTYIRLIYLYIIVQTSANYVSSALYANKYIF